MSLDDLLVRRTDQLLAVIEREVGRLDIHQRVVLTREIDAALVDVAHRFRGSMWEVLGS